jgi:hypothetical protein
VLIPLTPVANLRVRTVSFAALVVGETHANWEPILSQGRA